jgi:hypothetical protein
MSVDLCTRILRWRRLAWAVLALCVSHAAMAQRLAVNPSAAASDVRNPSSTNPAAAADIRSPSATNPSAAASQIPQPSAVSPNGRRMRPSIASQRTVVPPRRSRAVQRERRSKAAASQIEMTRPFEALEGARRDRIEFERRTAQEVAKQRQLEREGRAKKAAEARREAAEKRGAQPAGPSGKREAQALWPPPQPPGNRRSLGSGVRIHTRSTLRLSRCREPLASRSFRSERLIPFGMRLAKRGEALNRVGDALCCARDEMSRQVPTSLNRASREHDFISTTA